MPPGAHSTAVEFSCRQRRQTAPAAQADLDVLKNGASIGTVTFTAAASAATFTFASEVAFAAGDRLTVLAPSSQDASLADLSITFLGKRT